MVDSQEAEMGIMKLLVKRSSIKVRILIRCMDTYKLFGERKLSESCLQRESCRKGVCRERKLWEIKCKCVKLQCNAFYSYSPLYPTSHKFRKKLLL